MTVSEGCVFACTTFPPFFVALPFACIRQVRAGAEVSNAELVKFASLFNDELTMDNLDRVQLVSMCQLLSIPPFGTDGFLKNRLRSNLDAIKQVCRQHCSLAGGWGGPAGFNSCAAGGLAGRHSCTGQSPSCWRTTWQGSWGSVSCVLVCRPHATAPSLQLQDDLMIKAEGLDSLTDDELRTACKARGLKAAYGEGAASYMRKQMQVRRKLEAVSCALLCWWWNMGGQLARARFLPRRGTAGYQCRCWLSRAGSTAAPDTRCLLHVPDRTGWSCRSTTACRRACCCCHAPSRSPRPRRAWLRAVLVQRTSWGA